MSKIESLPPELLYLDLVRKQLGRLAAKDLLDESAPLDPLKKAIQKRTKGLTSEKRVEALRQIRVRQHCTCYPLPVKLHSQPPQRVEP